MGGSPYAGTSGSACLWMAHGDSPSRTRRTGHAARSWFYLHQELSSLLDGMKHAFAEQRKASLPIALPFDQLQLGHVSFHHAVIDPPGEPGPHRLFVLLDS